MGRKRKGQSVVVRMDDELYEQAHEYSEEHGFSLSALIRTLLRIQTDREDPREPPDGVDDEMKAYQYRPAQRKSRWKK